MSLRTLLPLAAVVGALIAVPYLLPKPHVTAETYLVKEFQPAVSAYRMRESHPQKANAMLKSLADEGKAVRVGEQGATAEVLETRTQTLTTDRGIDMVKVRIAAPPALAGDWWVNAEFVK